MSYIPYPFQWRRRGYEKRQKKSVSRRRRQRLLGWWWKLIDKLPSKYAYKDEEVREISKKISSGG